MSATKTGDKNSNVTLDILNEIEAGEPVARKESTREGSTFTPDAKTLATVIDLFRKTGAIHIRRAFATDKDARKGVALLLKHAEVAVDAEFPDKSVAVRIVQFTDDYRANHAWAASATNDQFRATVQLTHKRQSKPKTEEAK